MKNIFLVAAILLAVACQRATVPAATPAVYKETKNEGGQTILIGRNNISSMQLPAYKTWYDDSYNKYTPDATAIQQLKPLLQNKRMEVFLGTWCGDSRREVPRMIKVLQEAGMDTAKLSLVFVDNSTASYKQSPQHEERGRNIHHVPSFILFDGQKEMGRIIETPLGSLEKDLLAIARQQPYQPHYKAIEYWSKQVPDKNIDDAGLEKLVPVLKPMSRNAGEFNSYGYVLLGAKNNEEAIRIFKLNTLMYPADANTFDSLAEAYERTGKTKEAIVNYEKVLVLKPGDERAAKKIADLRKL